MHILANLNAIYRYKKPVDYTLDPSKQREMGWKMKVQLASVCVGNKAFDAC